RLRVRLLWSFPLRIRQPATSFYTLSLHDALPISSPRALRRSSRVVEARDRTDKSRVRAALLPATDCAPSKGRNMVSSRGPDKRRDRKSTRLNSSHVKSSYAVFCLKKKNKKMR